MKKLILVLFVTLFFVECNAYKAYDEKTKSNPFRCFVEEGGYREYALGDDRFTVSYEAPHSHGSWGTHNKWNQKTRAKSDQGIFNLAFRRCVELTINQGFKYFEILSEKGEDILTNERPNTGLAGAAGGGFIGGFIGGVAGSLCTTSVYNFTVTVEIRCFNEHKEGAYVANDYL